MKPCLTDDKNVLNKIKQYCESRERCKGCIYSIKKVDKQANGLWMCIFGNVPRDWTIKEDVNR